MIFASVDRVHAAGRFIQKEQFRIVEQGAHKVEAHLHPLGEGGDAGVDVICKPDHFQQFGWVTCWAGIERSKERQVFACRELLVVIG